MTDWQIHIPHRGREAPIYEIVECAREALDGDDRLVAEQLAWDALGRGTTTVGGLEDELEAAGPAGRRQILDATREAAGLETATEIDRARAAPPVSPRVPIAGFDDLGEFKRCSHVGCPAFPRDERGTIAPTSARRWWCPEHEHLAQPGDELPDDDGVATLGPNFQVIASPREQRQLAAREARERAERERRAEERRAEAAATAAAERRYVEANRDNPAVNFLAGPGWAGKT